MSSDSRLLTFDIPSYSTFCSIRRFFIRHFVPFGVFPFDILSHSVFFHSTFCPVRRFFHVPFDVSSIRHFVPFGVFSIRRFVPFGVLSFDVLSFDVLSIRRLLLRHFVGEPCGVIDKKITGMANMSPETQKSQERHICHHKLIVYTFGICASFGLSNLQYVQYVHQQLPFMLLFRLKFLGKSPYFTLQFTYV
jgi:hypothetical protein